MNTVVGYKSEADIQRELVAKDARIAALEALLRESEPVVAQYATIRLDCDALALASSIRSALEGKGGGA